MIVTFCKFLPKGTFMFWPATLSIMVTLGDAMVICSDFWTCIIIFNLISRRIAIYHRCNYYSSYCTCTLSRIAYLYFSTIDVGHAVEERQSHSQNRLEEACFLWIVEWNTIHNIKYSKSTSGQLISCFDSDNQLLFSVFFIYHLCSALILTDAEC